MDTKNNMQFVGILPGSFDPPHKGHVSLCEIAFDRGITEIIVVPAYNHPLKDNVTSFEHRMKMCRMSFKDKRIYISDIEKKIVKPEEKTYTIDTVIEVRNELSQKYGPEGFHTRLLVGDDLLTEIREWKSAQILFELVPLIVIKRGEISSTIIRHGFLNDNVPFGWLSWDVLKYIIENKLYNVKGD